MIQFFIKEKVISMEDMFIAERILISIMQTGDNYCHEPTVNHPL